MPKWNGGVIGVANNPTISSAKGIWSLSEATKAIRAGLWPPSNAGADPYFENVTMLLSADGTNGAQNNTFLDSSTNAFTITRNGNTTQGTFTPFAKPDGRWSNHFSTSEIGNTTTSKSGFDLSTGDWTVEAWVFPTASANQTILNLCNATNNNSGLNFWINSSNQLVQDNGATGTTAAGTITLNSWNHVAAVRTSGSTQLYVNGSSVGSAITQAPNTAQFFYVGRASSSGSPQSFSGYISNVRVVKGTAVYSGSSFTVPTAPLTAITNTQLLTCQSNRFIDNSSNALALTIAGTTTVQTFSPFPTLTAYAAGTNGGSGYFDGTGDYLTVADSASLEPGSSDFTIECWIYPTATGSFLGVFSKRTNNATDYSPIQILINSGTMILLASTSGSSWAVNVNASSSPPLNAWSHIAIVRNGTGSNNLVLYLNGVSVATGSVSSTALVNNAGAWAIAADSDDGGGNFAGYICGFRSVIGNAVYTSAFTPPTAPPTAITNTSLLLNYTNGGIIDNAMSNDLETVGNAQISTTQSKFGGSSMYFDGTGDYLISNSATTDLYAFGSGDFTIEMWVRFPSITSGVYTLYDSRPSGSQGAYASIALDQSTAKIYYYVSSATRITATNTVSTNTWYHVALARFGTSTKLFINGTQEGSTYTDSTTYLNPAARPVIGASGSSLGSEALNGYIDDLRVTKGIARYVQNFTPPTTAFLTL